MWTSAVLTLLALGTGVVSRATDLHLHKTRQELTLNIPGCLGYAGTQRVSFHDNEKLYEVFIPANGTTYNIGKDSSELSYVNISGSADCIPCDLKIDHIQLRELDTATLW